MTTPKRSDAETILRHWRDAVPNDRLAHLVKDATRALVRALSVRLAAHHVSFGHWAFLRILWEGDGITQRMLSERAGVMEPTTFSALKTMERLGYVTRSRMGKDRKKVYVFLTPKGRMLKERLVPLAEAVNSIAVRGVPAEHIAITRKVLLSVIENLARDEQTDRKPMPSTRAIAKVAMQAGRAKVRARAKRSKAARGR